MIATRNRCQELRRTLSKLSQLEPAADEILVCADGCTDDTIEMVRKEFPECRLFENKASKGSIFSRDQMLREARGEIVVSFDDDSYPLDNDFFVQLARSFDALMKTAVVSFAEVRDGETFAHSTKSSSSPAHLVSAYANCGAAMRRDIYLRSHGFPMFFGHMYEEPDYALQCYALGYVVRFEPTLAVRHHVSMNQRDSVRRHHLNARNELWSVFMRCPFPQLIVVATFRVWRQFRYACSEGAAWAIKEPIWWASALRGIHECVRNRHAVPWPIYYAWMKLARRPNAISKKSANAAKALT